MAKTFLLIDIGATNSRFALSDGQALRRVLIHPTAHRWEDQVEHFRLVKGELLGEKTPDHVVVGLPGEVDSAQKTLVSCVNIRGWEGKPVARVLRSIFSCPVMLMNDASLNALGEARYGAGRGEGIMGFLTISSGVNGARTVNGILDEGAFSYELRLLPSHSRPGHSLGSTISGFGLAKRHGKDTRHLRDRRIWTAGTKEVAQAIVTLSLAWRPTVFVLGGPLFHRQALRLADVRREVKSLWRHSAPPPKLVLGTLGQQSGLYGALVMALAKKT